MSEQSKKTPEKRLIELSTIGFGKIKKIVTLIFLLIGYWQTIKYFTEKPNLNVYLEDSHPINEKFATKITIVNGSQSISKTDFVKPITINLSEQIIKVQSSEKFVNSKFQIFKNSLIVTFDLLNKDELFSFIIITNERPKIKNIEGRIKSVEEIFFNDYELKPKPLNRFLNVWAILILASIILFIDALLVIGKDIELQRLLSFSKYYNLKKSNIEEYIEKYGEYYSEWKVNIKPNKEFMQDIIRNLFISFPHQTKNDFEFIKDMACFKTNIYSFYRVRTVFIVIGPILFFISFCAIILNYFYFEINGLSEIISLTDINKIATTILLILGIFVILFPSRTMNLVVLGKL